MISFIASLEKFDRHRNRFGLFQCECGKLFETSIKNWKALKSPKSCGCLTMNKLMTKHGMSGSDEYWIRHGIIQRCTNSNNRAYKNYGGRGIKVCEEWLKSFEKFYKDVGNRPGKEYSLDRINNDEGYKPGNVRWATSKEQGDNKRNTKKFTFNGITKTNNQWADCLGIKMKTFAQRIRLHGDLKEEWKLKAFELGLQEK